MQVANENSAVEAKERAVFDALDAAERVIVAFSGGVDSTYLAWAAHRVLGPRAEALTARSASLSGRELEAAQGLAATIGIAHRIIDTRELDRPEYRANAPSRCFYCKDTLFDAAGLLAKARPGTVVVDGFNADDLMDHRPGHAAAAQRGVRHPLAEAGLSKAEIRALSRRAGLATWNKPQLACLSSRVPYGMEVTADRLSRVERMEDVLRDLGFFDVRARLVRENDEMVRLEVGDGELTRAFEARGALVEAGRKIGFRFVTLDLEGFRSGRMNEGLVQLRRSDSAG